MTGAIRADQDPCRRSARRVRRRDRHHGAARPFASNNPVTGNIVGNGNISILSGNNVQIPVQIPVDICGNAVGLLGFANASCVGGAAALLDDSGN
jgi:hypothetical protein